MIRAALVKPDHLGDLVLSVPAIRAAAAGFDEVVLYVASTSRVLAQFLFPDLEIRVLDFPHLARRPVLAPDPQRLAAELDAFDLVLWLRDDAVIRAAGAHLRVRQDWASGGHLTHETAIQKRMLLRHLPNYSRTRLFAAQPIGWPARVRSVGLCVAAGFPTNRWPAASWFELASELARRGVALTLIGGPGERDELALLSRCLSAPHRVLPGGQDFAAFLDALRDVDLVVATDGGTGHICSLSRPMLSLFGSSPWRRYAPFGAANVLLTADRFCSPCVQFATDQVNGCLTRECLTGVTARAVLGAFDALTGAGPARHGLHVQRGTSHCFEE